jgi:hypothetical protein
LSISIPPIIIRNAKRYEPFRGCVGEEFHGYARLMINVLAQQIVEYVMNYRAGNPCDRKMRKKEAELYLFDDSHSDWVFSLHCICETLGLSVELVRKMVRILESDKRYRKWLSRRSLEKLFCGIVNITNNKPRGLTSKKRRRR